MRRYRFDRRSLNLFRSAWAKTFMRDVEKQLPAVFTNQHLGDVIERLQLVTRLTSLTGPDELTLQMQRDFIFGIMSERQAAECRALYNFIFKGIDFPTVSTTSPKESPFPSEPGSQQ